MKNPPDRSPQDGRRAGALRLEDKLLLALHLPIVAVLILPVAPALWSAKASFFGLPRSIVTIVFLLCCSFVAVLIHFWSEPPEKNSLGDEGQG